MARKFLYIIASLIVLVIIMAFAYRVWGQQLINATMVPSQNFAAPSPLPKDAYARAHEWIARPGLPRDPSQWRPSGVEDAPIASKAAIFFVHPTTYLAPANKAAWNAPITDAVSQATAARFVQRQASAFNELGPIWAPRYRQAHFGAFLTDRTDGQKAIDAAYADVAEAFDAFLAANPHGPIILAGHSQGSLHLLRLLHEKVAGRPVAARVAAAYIIGWPVSVEADIPALGLPACTKQDQAHCIVSWQSFAEPADPSAIEQVFNAGNGFTDKPRKGTRILCVNPLTGTTAGSAVAGLNLGTLDARQDENHPVLVKGAVPARCDANGFLLIGNPPDLGPFTLPGNNYHVYDYALFWANLRADSRARLAAFSAKR
ncbi:MAG: DUF3089 domain-containing protein [Sphingobium sp.]